MSCPSHPSRGGKHDPHRMGCACASIRQGRNEAPGGASSRHAALRHEVARARKSTTPNTICLVHLIRRAVENTIPTGWGARAPQSGKAGMRHLAALPAVTPRFATRSPAQEKIPPRTQKGLSISSVCWHLLTKDEDYLWARPALVAN